ncbi:FAD/NAD(P)-binding domain-containing protein [Artomyces pyxidatus]|uniref:FAD/NAD(P)-binding domain-containing protein n=1 Tax=Artomyces pyxidatus TaxID=48021 RepID=A0ACB8SN22_9AGAM|nr:FAD/NAD(P)-binding domain-containing protein [Artomyces pyxidatus]
MREAPLVTRISIQMHGSNSSDTASCALAYAADPSSTAMGLLTWLGLSKKRNGVTPQPLGDNGRQFKASNAGDFAVDEYRPMKVVCIGAGYSGLIAGIRFSQKVPNLDLRIYEKAAGIGGTWWANKYPGISCDVPSHSYQLTFEEYSQWSGFYATGNEILAYLHRVVEKYKLMRYIRLQHELVQARWDEPSGKWQLRIRRGDTGEEFEDKADVLFLGTGTLSRPRLPDIPGLGEFRGRVVHSGRWDVSDEGVKDWADKRVGVIGNGASGIQIVAALQSRVGTLTNFARGRTWIAESFSASKLLELMGRNPDSTDFGFTDADRERFKDPAVYKEFRRALENDVNSVSQVTIRGTELQKIVATICKEDMVKRLAKKPELIDKIVPEFSICCRRLTPGPGYLEALCADNATLETTPISKITPTGVTLSNGTHRPLDVLICATGFDTTYKLPFPVIGRDGRALNDRWASRAEAYLTVAVDGFPNMFLGTGPNSFVNAGSLLIIMERQVMYAVNATLKMQRERLRTMEVRAEAVHDWREYMEAFFPKMVYTESCHSWYKNADGKIVGLWPGTCMHAVRALANPRWEDYTYTPVDKTSNRLFWLGDGQTHNEKTLTGDRAWYLNDEEVDVPPVPGNDEAALVV